MKNSLHTSLVNASFQEGIPNKHERKVYNRVWSISFALPRLLCNLCVSIYGTWTLFILCVLFNGLHQAFALLMLLRLCSFMLQNDVENSIKKHTQLF